MPDVAVVVPSHDRPVRLRWLLDALEEQTLPPERYEVVVVHDSDGDETEDLLASHALAAAGRLRHRRFEPATGSPAAMRNAGWRESAAALIAFTDDDCRPEPDWLERLLTAAASRPRVIVQGRTRPDPDELGLLLTAPWARTMDVEPPTVWAETCNIAYPRALLEELGGFDERLPGPAGEDTDLATRARGRGATLVAAPEAVVNHAVETPWLGRRLRGSWRWQHVAAVVKRNPQLRRELFAGIWWKREHTALFVAVAGVAARRRPAAAALALPWLALATSHRGYGARGLARSVAELPGRAALDATELAALAYGSARYRTLVL